MDDAALYYWQIAVFLGLVLVIVGALMTGLLHAFKKTKVPGAVLMGFGAVATIIPLLVMRLSG